MTTTMLPKDSARSCRIPFYVIAAAYFVLVAVWSLAIPFNGAPDEATHFYLVEYLYKFRSMPQPGLDPSVPFDGLLSGSTIAKDSFWYFGLPYLNSLGATTTALLTASLFPEGATYLSARLFNWLLAPCFALSMLTIGRRCGLSCALAILSASIFLLVPQATFLFSYFNADAFGLTSTAVGLALLLSSLEKSSTARTFLFGATCGLIVCSKIYYIPSLVFFVIIIAFKGLTDESFRTARFLSTCILGCLIISLPVLGITYLQFGDATGIKGQVIFTAMFEGKVEKKCYIGCESGFLHFRNLYLWLGTAFISFFFGLGWLNVFVRPEVYYFYFGPLILLLLAASIYVSSSEARRFNREGLAALWIGVITLSFWSMAAAVVVLNILGSQKLLPQAQGRYLYVVFPFAYFLLASLLGHRRIAKAPTLARPGGHSS